MNQTSQDALKKQAAEAALKLLPENAVLGIGTGSTVNFLIDMLPQINPEACVSSSEASSERIKALGIDVLPLNTAGTLDFYIDGADEVDRHLHMVKGGGGALTREKIVAAASRQFICMVDESKWVDQLGRAFPLPVEVIPMARSYVARQLVELGGDPTYREGFVTDNGNVILDVYNMNILNAIDMEKQINNIAGVVCNGLFAQRGADTVLLAKASGVEVVSA